MSLAILTAFILLFAALIAQRKIAKLAWAHNRELRDRIVKQADVIGQKDAINESLRLALISRGGLVAVDEWPDEIYR